jgi:apolipoprotein N-acyltransferase
VNGLIVEWALCGRRPEGARRRLTNAVAGTIAVAVLLAGNVLYGKFRLDQSAFQEGPRVAVVQEDFALVSTPPYGEHHYVIFAKYMALAAEAAREAPDLLVFPETVWSVPQNIDFVERVRQATGDEGVPGTWSDSKLFHDATAAFARGDYATVNATIARLERRLRAQRAEREAPPELPRLPAEGGPAVPLIVGSVALEILPEEVYPRTKNFNSALVYDKDGQQRAQRYNKIHLVPFGEFVPFRNATFLGIDLHWLYRVLNRVSPFSHGGEYEYSLWPGEEYLVFELDAAGQPRRFGVPICYEDTVPYLARNFVWQGGERRVDFLVNISNDGWFLHSDELPQHLAICVFRAVENRVGIARAVNTGISGFIDPAGRVYSVVTKDGRTYGRGTIGYEVASVLLDERISAYGRFGDWFALICVAGTLALWTGAVATRWVYALRKRFAQRRARTGR